MIRKFSILALFAFSALALAAQPKAKFQKTTLDLGKVAWHSPVATTIRLTNSGNKPLVISAVETDCSCTVANWETKSIAPGNSTNIVVNFNAETLGTINRVVSVTTNAAEEPVDILLTGQVAPTEVDHTAEFPFKVDDVMLTANVVDFGDVRKGEHPEVVVRVLNNGKKNYTPEFMHLPTWLSAKSQPAVLAPGRMGNVTFTLDTDELPGLGSTQSKIYVARYQGDKVRKSAEMNVGATLLPALETVEQQVGENVTPGSAETNADVPLAVIPAKLALGKKLGKKKVKGSLTLANKGKKTLVVSAVQVYNPGLSVVLADAHIEPGSKTSLKVEASADVDKYKGRTQILIITNDPVHPKLVVDVVAE